MIFVVVPARNEARNIGRVVAGLVADGWTHVVVVDDGSTDATAATAEQAGAVVLRHAVNRGQGAALMTGTMYALHRGAEKIVHFDGDGQFASADIANAVRIMDATKSEVVFGSRFLDNRSQIPWSKRYLVLPFARVVNFVFTGIWLSDAHNGFRVVSRRFAEQLHIYEDRMAHNSEIVAQVRQSGVKWAEVGVMVSYETYGQRAMAGFEILHDLLWSFFFKR